MTDQLIEGRFTGQLPDTDAGLTGEWLDSLDDLVDSQGAAAARLMLARLLGRAAERDVGFRTTVGIRPLERGGDGHPGQRGV